MNETLRDKLRGKFIVLDGPDGCGKTTQLELLAGALTAAGLDIVRAKDPGGTRVGDRIREILLGKDLDGMDIRCETLLFMASRAQLVTEIIAPALKAGRCVLCDRFISSTCAYQGARGYDVAQTLHLGQAAVGRTWPDLTCVFDLPAEVGLDRAARRTSPARASGGGATPAAGALDAMESRPIEFHRRVREIFRALADHYPRTVTVIDAGGTVQEVHARVMEGLERVDF